MESRAQAPRHPCVGSSRYWGKSPGSIFLPEAVAAAQERSRARDLDATVTELLDELEGWNLHHPLAPRQVRKEY
jgi:hypothetical protein